MKKTPFQKKATAEFMKELIDICIEKEINPNINITSKYRNTYFKIRHSYNLIQVTVKITGEITYQLTDMLGISSGTKEYYSYGEKDDHEAVIQKFIADFSRFIKDFYAAETLHDFDDITLSYAGDIDKELESYEEYIESGC